jgi:CRISPR-associated endonuclease/helicase Cas3
MSALCPDDFPQFFRELNGGADPFPWQEWLARQVFDQGVWPECLDLPTGSGKTAVLEVAIFHLALDVRRQTAGRLRRAPVRIAFVVDRRLIVDQTERRARGIQKALTSNSGIIGPKVAAELRKLAGEDAEPLIVQTLRGGLPREADWARTPVQPTILLSTVDQVGSRLLFRGYGVSNSMRPVHAGLLGSDCLLFLDEAHLSEPFRQSLESVARYRARPWIDADPGPWGVSTLSATPGSAAGDRLQLSPDDYDHQLLGPRLRVSKPAELREIGNKAAPNFYADLAREIAKDEGIAKILVVVNRVDLARAIFEHFRGDEALLLTGRVRDLDRERIVKSIEGVLKESGRRVFAIATQCVEAGADYDFDALVTQIAPLDALRQRFGRLNRKGRPIEARAFIAASKEDLAPRKPDPVYGSAAKEAWALLKRVARTERKRAVVDFGVLAFSEMVGQEDMSQAISERPDAPTMPPAYVDLWTCTNPPPALEPEVALFLHGPERASADVEIVWRADVAEQDLRDRERMIELISLAPPRSGEMLAAPLWSVRRWLIGDKSAARVSDTEGEPESSDEDVRTGLPVFRWCGEDDLRTGILWPHQIRPGDVIVVPTRYGGCDGWGWTGRREPAASDLATEAAARMKTANISVRLHPAFSFADTWHRIAAMLEAYHDDGQRLRDELHASGLLPEIWRDELDRIAVGTEEVVMYFDEPTDGLILTGRRIWEKNRTVEPSTERNVTKATGDHALLTVHTAAVVKKVEQFTEPTGLTDSVRRALVFAALFHDSGKADRRFQAYLNNGIGDGRLLAKSRRAPPRGAAERRTRERANLPEDWRHEALSVRVAIDSPRFAAEADHMDAELALWLIGTHHGWGRPFFPHDDSLDESQRTVAGIDGQTISLPASPGPQRLDFSWNGLDWATLFERLRRRYGPWELARLEAILRLADHRASEEGDVERAHPAGIRA